MRQVVLSRFGHLPLPECILSLNVRSRNVERNAGIFDFEVHGESPYGEPRLLVNPRVG